VTGDGGTIDVAFLTHHIDFGFEYLVASGFFMSVLAIFSILPIDTLIWLQYSVLFGLNVNVFSFPLIFSFIILAMTSIVALMVLKNSLPKMRGV
jgi:hypothetical protein